MQLVRMWAYMDFGIFIFSTYILIQSFSEENTVNARIVEAILLVWMTIKSLYFLRLFGEIAPLIDIIFVIVSDIKWFILIYVIGLLCFVMSFYIIG
jgi:hypothetical protein